MKQSKYNIEVQRLENNKMLFFNSVTRAFVALDENTYNYICAKKITLPTDDDELLLEYEKYLEAKKAEEDVS